MPLPLSPNDRFELSLKSDEEIPQADRPTFLFRHLSGREQREMAAMFDELDQAKTTVDAMDITFRLLKHVLAGWRNLADPSGEPIEYSRDGCEDVLQFREAQELVYRAWGYAPSVEGLGESDSQSSTSTDESAKAPAERA